MFQLICYKANWDINLKKTAKILSDSIPRLSKFDDNRKYDFMVDTIENELGDEWLQWNRDNPKPSSSEDREVQLKWVEDSKKWLNDKNYYYIFYSYIY